MTSPLEVKCLKVDEYITEAQLYEVVRKTVNGSDFSIEDVKIRPASEDTLGYCGDHLRMAIDFKVDGIVKTSKYFVKGLPKNNEEKMTFFDTYGMASEGKAFKLIEDLKEFIGNDPFCAECYYASDNLLVFDDLALQGYESNDPRKPFLKEHCLTALTSLANFHASSFIFEEVKSRKDGQKFRLSEEYKDVFQRSLFDMKPFYKTSLQTMLKMAELFSKHAKDENKLKLIREKWYPLWERSSEMANPSPLCRNPLGHRDLWARNLLYKYEGGVPTQCLLADFQTVGCVPPAADVHSAIYLNTTTAQRTEFYEEFINHYYRQLTKKLRKYDLNVEDFVPREEFSIWCKKYRMWGVINGLAWHSIFIRSDYISDVLSRSGAFDQFFHSVSGRVKIVEEAMRNDLVYYNIILGYIDDFIENHILTNE